MRFDKTAMGLALDLGFCAGGTEEHMLMNVLRDVEHETIKSAAKVCRDYAHSGKENVYRRQVAYALERRILALGSVHEGKADER